MQASWRSIARSIKELSGAYRHDEKLAVAGILVLESGLPLEDWCSRRTSDVARQGIPSKRLPRPSIAPLPAVRVEPNENSVSEVPEPVFWAGKGNAPEAGEGSIIEVALRDARRLAIEDNPDLKEVERASRLLNGLAELFHFVTDQLAKQPDGLERTEIRRLRHLYTSSRRNFLKARDVLLRGLQDPVFKVRRIRGRHPTKVSSRERKTLYADTHARVLKHRPSRKTVPGPLLRQLLLEEFRGNGDEGVPLSYQLEEMHPSLIALRITAARVRVAEGRFTPPRRFSRGQIGLPITPTD